MFNHISARTLGVLVAVAIFATATGQVVKRLLIVAAIAVIAAPALAGSDILPINGIAGHLKFDVATGKVTPITRQTRDVGPPVWDSFAYDADRFWAAEPFAGEASIEWADLTIGQGIGGFGFTAYTNSQAADGDLYAIFLFYEEENGHDSSATRVYVGGYLIANMPGSERPPNQNWGYVWSVELEAPFVLDGSDMDGDGLGDWGYFGFFSGRTPDAPGSPCLHGPGLAELIDPNNLPPECPGVEDAFDLHADPNYNVSMGASIDPNALTGFVGTYWFNGPPVFSQWIFRLYAPICAGDLDGDGDVDLTDLATLLANYGVTSGAAYEDGDLDGDEDVDLTDLAALLAVYGTTCP